MTQAASFHTANDNAAAAPARGPTWNWRLILAVAFCALGWATLLKGCF